MVGRGKRENIIYLIDFGLVKKVTECRFNVFVNTNCAPRKMAGTPIYSSINAHLATGGNFIHFSKN
jgi:hypothetical protein